MEDTAEWSATGLENQGVLTDGRSIRLSSAKLWRVAKYWFVGAAC